MRVLNVWFTATIIVTVLTLSWYITNGVVITIASQALADIDGQAFSLLTLVEFTATWWGPLLDVVVLLWAIISSQEVDPFSRTF